jgi:hypothetical protein
MALKHDTTHPKPSLWGADHTTGDEEEGDALRYRSGEWVAEKPSGGMQVVMRVGISNPPEPVLTPAGDGWVYAEV